MSEFKLESDAVFEELSPGRRTALQVGIGVVCCGYLGMITYPVYRYLASPLEKAAAASAVNEVTLPDADRLPTGSALMFRFGTTPAMLIHLKDGTWSALSAVCTHLACTVQYEPEEDRIFCACHGGVYDPKTGGNRAGPPPRPLPAYQVVVNTGSVTVKRAAS